MFRRRFRVPYVVFDRIVSLVRERNLFRENCDAIGRPAHPLEVKILGVLRILGRGVCYDDISELTNISEEVIRVFFNEFVSKFSKECYNMFVKPPDTDIDMNDYMSEYEIAGFQGNINIIYTLLLFE